MMFFSLRFSPLLLVIDLDENEIPSKHPPHPSVLVGGVGQRRRAPQAGTDPVLVSQETLDGSPSGVPRMCEPCTPDALIKAVRGLRMTDLGPNSVSNRCPNRCALLTKLREQQPDLGAATRGGCEALNALKAESEAAKAAAAAAAQPTAQGEHGW